MNFNFSSRAIRNLAQPAVISRLLPRSGVFSLRDGGEVRGAAAAGKP